MHASTARSADDASTKVAVQRGLNDGRAVVTAAAIIMISVFAGLIFSDSSTIKPIGFGSRSAC